MGRIWIVHLTSDDGTDLDGRLEVGVDRVRFTPGTHGGSMPSLEIPHSEIVSVEVDTRGGVRHRVVVGLGSGGQIVFDHGLRPVDELAALLDPSTHLSDQGPAASAAPDPERTT